MATYYIDNNRGVDTASGTSMQTPWKTLGKIASIGAVGPGTNFLLADDSEWINTLSTTRPVLTSGSTGTMSNPVVIGKYSPSSQSPSGQKPRIQWYKKIAANEWTYDGANNAWVYTDATFQIGTYSLVRIANTWGASSLGSDTVLPLPSILGRYYPSNDASKKLYMYSPGGGAAGTDPTSYYGEVLLSIGGSGFFSVSSDRGFVRIEDLHFVNTGTGVLSYSGTAADMGLTVRRVSGWTVANLIACTSSTPGQAYNIVEDCTISNYACNAIWAYTIGGGGMKQMIIRNNNISNGNYCFAQGGIYFQCRSTGLGSLIYDNKLSNCQHTSPNFLFDGCGIYIESGSDNVKVFRNTVSDSFLAFQDNSGRKAEFFSNLVLNCASAMVHADGVGNNLGDHTFANNTCIVGANISPANGVSLSATQGVGWQGITNGTFSNISIYNNIFINTGSSVNAAIRRPNVIPTTYDYTYNAGYNYTDMVAIRPSPFTADATPTGSVLNQAMNMDLNTGALTTSSPAYHTGKLVTVKNDFYGGQYYNPPSMGCKEFRSVRGTR